MIILSLLETVFYIASGVLWLFLATFLIEGFKPLSLRSKLILFTLVASCFFAVVFCAYSVGVAWHGE